MRLTLLCVCISWGGKAITCYSLENELAVALTNPISSGLSKRLAHLANGWHCIVIF